MPNKMTITKDEALKQVIAQLEGSIALDEFVKRVLADFYRAPDDIDQVGGGKL